EQVDAAIDSYQAARQADPDDPDVARTLAELLAQVGRLEEARAVVVDLAARRPLPNELTLLLARIEAASGHATDAEARLQAFLRRSPGNGQAIEILAGILEEQKRYDEAIGLFAPLIEGGSERSGLHRRVGTLELQAGRPRDAAVLLERGLLLEPDDAASLLLLVQAYDLADDLPAAAKACERLIGVDPEGLEPRFHQARVLRRSGDLVAARAAFEDLLRRAAARPALEPRDESVVTLAATQAGVLAFGARDWRAVVNWLSVAVARLPQPEIDVLRLLAQAHLEAGEYDGAEKARGDALRVAPDDPELLALEGEIALARGGRDAAMAAYRRTLETLSGTAPGYLAVARSLLRRHEYGMAEVMLREAIGRYPADDQMQFERGAALDRLGRRPEAERALARAIELNPGNAMALNYLAYMLAESGRRLNDSLAYVERALALDPGNPAYLDSLGWTLFKLERYAPAEEKLRAALRYDATDPVLREHLGDLLNATGRTDEAVREWQAALQCGHEDPDRIRGKLQRARAGAPAGR
ncbi:MAG TPA: tetratricopeptide repeat protein, partial [Dongiaceae bacterium]|nr:tetratricopeptide repeat protein [Dongiaceae bacterium]